MDLGEVGNGSSKKEEVEKPRVGNGGRRVVGLVGGGERRRRKGKK